ncbi:MAG: hypothetical protein JO267_14425 [Alphaproteobacteria bacterium]|nr:hypothetical protein [Alphaproteobacteria bacterium]
MDRSLLTEAGVTRTIAAVYEAAVAPSSWPRALEEIRDLFAVESAAFVIHNQDRSHVDGMVAGVDPELHRVQLNTLFRTSVFYARKRSWYSGQIVPHQDVVPNRIFHRSRMYQEYWRPLGLHDGLRLTVSVDTDGVHQAVNLIRSKSQAPIGQTDTALARFVMPHLQHAVALRRRLGAIDALASAALSAFDRLQHPLLFLDQDGRVLHASAAAESLMGSNDGLSISNGCLVAPTAAMANKLHAVIARATAPPPRAGALRLTRPSGRLPLAVMAMPFRSDAHWSLPRRPAVLLCVTEPDGPWAPRGSQLAELFGLTGAEAALAADLLCGRDLREIAERRGRSLNTVRVQLARLMAKTDVNRQSELVRLLASLPRMKDAP